MMRREPASRLRGESHISDPRRRPLMMLFPRVNTRAGRGLPPLRCLSEGLTERLTERPPPFRGKQGPPERESGEPLGREPQKTDDGLSGTECKSARGLTTATLAT